jgi:lipopolysaccharide transport system permease protein
MAKYDCGPRLLGGGVFSDLRALVSSLISHRALIWEFSRRNLFERYKGHSLGFVWSFVHPAMLILVYIFLFGVVFNSRVHFTETMPQSFTSYILAGLVPWFCIQNAMQGGAQSLSMNAKFIKQVVFPPEVFPAQAVLSAFFIECIYMVLLIVYNVIMAAAGEGTIGKSFFLLPVAIFIQISFLLGISYFFAIIGAYFRDFGDLIQILCLIGIYIAPIVYLPEAIPRLFRPIIFANPLSYFIWMFQDVLYYGRIDHWYAWVVTITLAAVFFIVGGKAFMRGKAYLGSVL